MLGLEFLFLLAIAVHQGLLCLVTGWYYEIISRFPRQALGLIGSSLEMIVDLALHR